MIAEPPHRFEDLAKPPIIRDVVANEIGLPHKCLAFISGIKGQKQIYLGENAGRSDASSREDPHCEETCVDWRQLVTLAQTIPPATP